jgi:hypothetical protein
MESDFPMPTHTKALFAVLVVAAALGAWAPELRGYPLPSALGKSWTFEISYATPRPVLVPDVDGVSHWYWYLPYTVVNRTGADRMFVPEVLVVTEDGTEVHAGRGVPARVFAAVKERLNHKYLVDPVRAVGKLLQGDDNALESVAIWPAPAASGVHLRIFFAGLSGETDSFQAPQSDIPVTVGKTLMLEYQMPGKPPTPAEQPVLFDAASWVMR